MAAALKRVQQRAGIGLDRGTNCQRLVREPDRRDQASASLKLLYVIYLGML